MQKNKGYVRIVTSLGNLNVEVRSVPLPDAAAGGLLMQPRREQLHCDLAPRTCDNFLRLCRRGYYRGTVFHRNVRGFIVQGGDPTGTGRDGESAFDGAPFGDEIRPRLVHDGRGVLSMANRGPNTNRSQFFFTYAPCPCVMLLLPPLPPPPATPDRAWRPTGSWIGSTPSLAASSVA